MPTPARPPIFLISCFISLVVGYNFSTLALAFFELYTTGLVMYIAASVFLMLIMGILLSGSLSEKWARKSWLMTGFIGLSLVQLLLAYATHLLVYWATLLLGSFSLAILLSVMPVYLAEIAPCEHRGRYMLALFLGIFISVLSFILAPIDQLKDPAFIFLAACILSLIACFLSSRLLESPRWLMQQGQDSEAEEILKCLRSPKKSTQELTLIKGSFKKCHRPWKVIFKNQLRTKIKTSALLALMRQSTGIVFWVFYISKLLSPAMTLSFLLFLALSSVLLGLGLALFFVDSLGRRSLLLLSFLGQGIALLNLSLGLILGSFVLSVGSFLMMILCFALGAGPVAWLSWIELIPTGFRSSINSLMLVLTLSTGILVYIVSRLALQFIDLKSLIFCYSALSFVAFAYCWKKLPETKHRLLEEI